GIFTWVQQLYHLLQAITCLVLFLSPLISCFHVNGTWNLICILLQGIVIYV
ncbi:hypothetical protein LINPERHAP2_LOCUS6129, partial [Linum perenne]